MTGRPGSTAAEPARQNRPASDLADWTIGVVGLGVMGAGMATRLHACGASLRLYNRTADRARTLAAQCGAKAAATPAEAADDADLVLVSVADGAALGEVIRGPGGLVSAKRFSGTVLNATTVAPDTVRRLARDVALLDAGVLGNGEHARGGLLRWYVGGDDALLTQAAPVLDALGQQTRHVGPLGSGMRLKLAMNLLMGFEMQALAEVITFGTRGGLDRQLVIDTVLDSGFTAPVMRFKATRMAARSYGQPDFRLRLMAKDLALALGETSAAGADSPMLSAAAETHERAVSAGIGEVDCAAITQFLEDQPGEVG